MNENKLISTLKTLKLYGMAQTVEELNQQASPVYLQSIPLLQTLMAAEIAERDVRSINYQIKTAKFPAHRDLAGLRVKLTLPRPSAYARSSSTATAFVFYRR